MRSCSLCLSSCMCNDQLPFVHARLPHRIACAMINLCETSKVALYKWIKGYQLVFLMIKLYFWPQSHFIVTALDYLFCLFVCLLNMHDVTADARMAQ